MPLGLRRSHPRTFRAPVDVDLAPNAEPAGEVDARLDREPHAWDHYRSSRVS